MNSPLAESQGLLDAQVREWCFRNSPFNLLWCWKGNTSPKYVFEVTGLALISPMLV